MRNLLHIYFLLGIVACNVKNDYRIPNEFHNKNLINGTTKTFADSLTNECLAIFEKIELNNDTFYTKIEFNNNQIFDSTYGRYGQLTKTFKLNTEYGLLNGISKTLDLKEKESSSSSVTEVNFADKISSIIHIDKKWTYLDNETILEVVNNNISYLDKIKNRQWEINSIDSIYYGKSTGLQRMKLFFKEENYKIDFILVQVSIAPIRQKYIKCEQK